MGAYDCDCINNLEYEKRERKAQLSQEGTTSDLISRHDALDIFDDYNISVENGELEAYSRDRKRLCELPAAQPEPHEGHWIEGKIYRDVIECYCSECGQIMTTAATVRMNYCPNCGADMGGEKDG